MTKTVTSIPILSGINTAGSGSKGTPIIDSGWIDVGAYDGGDLFLSIQNGGALGQPGILQIQGSASANGANGADIQAVIGDMLAQNTTTLAGITTAAIWLDPGVRAVRVFAYNNTTNNISVTVTFGGVTRS